MPRAWAWIGGQNLYANTARRGPPPQTPWRLFGVYVFYFFFTWKQAFLERGRNSGHSDLDRFTRTTVQNWIALFSREKRPELRRKRGLYEPLLTAMAQVLPILISGMHQTSFCLLRHLSFQSWKRLWCILFPSEWRATCSLTTLSTSTPYVSCFRFGAAEPSVHSKDVYVEAVDINVRTWAATEPAVLPKGPFRAKTLISPIIIE